MSFTRNIFPSVIYKDDALTGALISIGIRLAGSKLLKVPNIEDVLISASIEGVSEEDYRVLGLLVDWIETHVNVINVDRLHRVVSMLTDTNVKLFWKAVAQWQKKDIRFQKIDRSIRQLGRVLLLGETSAFIVSKHGEDERFIGTCLIIPSVTLRRRLDDVLSPVELSKELTSYRYRLMMGPSYRADIWAYLTKDRSLRATDLARLTYSNIATAWEVKEHFEIVNPKPSKQGTAA